MGVNEVVLFDLVFFLYYFNIDCMFWVWQKKYKKMNLDIFIIDNRDEEDKGILNSN